ncbi:MAG: RNA polymerase sigma factor, partial [Chitinophagaceae bacterium]
GQHVNIEDRNFASADEVEERQSLRQKEEMLNKMAEAVNELSAEQKTCINLFYLQKQTYQEIVEKTGFNMMQVKSYIQNGKRNLKNNLLKRLEHER